jgi:chromate transporter
MPNPSGVKLGKHQTPLKEVFLYFLRLGLTGFGGPLALLSSMQRDLIHERQWMTPDVFLRAFTLIKAMPGPMAFQTAVFLGRYRAGWPGGFAALFGLIGPSFLMMVLFGIFYDQWKGISAAQEFLTGMQAAALGVILATLGGLAYPHRLKRIFWTLAGFATLVTVNYPAIEPLLIVVSGTLTAIIFQIKHSDRYRKFPKWLHDLRLVVVPLNSLALQQCFLGNSEILAALPLLSKLGQLVWCCFKSGAFVFGSGLAIVPLMESDFVINLGWLTHQEFMDALAFGQITPGPFVITATFIGFRSSGLLGAVAATVAIFFAPFFHMMTWFPRFNERLSRLPWISAFLIGAMAAVVGAILASTFNMLSSLDQKSVTIPLSALVIVGNGYYKIPTWVLIPLGGLLTVLFL